MTASTKQLPIGERLKRARGAQSMTACAQKAGVHLNWWSRIEKGQTKWDDHLELLSRVVSAVGGKLIVRFPEDSERRPCG